MPTNNEAIVPKPDDKFVLLEGIRYGNRFFTTHTPGEDPTKSAKGETWYRILGYAATIKEAQDKLHSTPFIDNRLIYYKA